MDSSRKNFFIVSGVGRKSNIPGNSSSYITKFVQKDFIYDELMIKDNTCKVSLNQDEIAKVQEFIKNYKSQAYYLFTPDGKTHFTFKNFDAQPYDTCVKFNILKVERLVYPEVEKV